MNLATAAAVALRARQFQKYSALLALGKEFGITVAEVSINAVKERDFGELLRGIFAGVTPIHGQYRIGTHRIDFVLPELRLAVEYDEAHHAKPQQGQADKRRQDEIVAATGLEFIRVKQGEEIAGLNGVLKHFLASRRESVSAN